MKEIDDRYPEFAEPYEPVKGGKHHKRLSRRSLPLLCGALVLALTFILVIPPTDPPAIPDSMPRCAHSTLNTSA